MQVLTPGLNIGGPVGAAHYGPLIGFGPMIYRFRLQVGSVAVGDVLQMDLISSDAGATTQDAAATSVFGVLIAPRAGLILQNEAGAVAVVTDLLDGAGADNTDVKACIYGLCTAGIVGGGGNMSVDSMLVAVTTKRFDLVHATGERVFAQGASALTAVTTVQYGQVFLHNNCFPWGPIQAA